jgi:hypothetical protein
MVIGRYQPNRFHKLRPRPGTTGGSRQSVYLREFESEIPYPFDDAMQRRLIVDPTSKSRFVRTGSSHLETLECSHHADAESPAYDQLVFRPPGGRGLSPTEGRTVLSHTRDGATVAGTRTTMAEPTQRVPDTMMETSWSVAVMVRSHSRRSITRMG